MRAGLLTEIINILRPALSRNEFGEQEETYEKHYTTKARVINNSGNREDTNGELRISYIKTFEVWKYVDIKDTDWIEWEGKRYRILSIDLDKVQQKKTIKTEEVNE